MGKFFFCVSIKWPRFNYHQCLGFSWERLYAKYNIVADLAEMFLHAAWKHYDPKPLELNYLMCLMILSSTVFMTVFVATVSEAALKLGRTNRTVWSHTKEGVNGLQREQRKRKKRMKRRRHKLRSGCVGEWGGVQSSSTSDVLKTQIIGCDPGSDTHAAQQPAQSKSATSTGQRKKNSKHFLLHALRRHRFHELHFNSTTCVRLTWVMWLCVC